MLCRSLVPFYKHTCAYTYVGEKFLLRGKKHVPNHRRPHLPELPGNRRLHLQCRYCCKAVRTWWIDFGRVGWGCVSIHSIFWWKKQNKASNSNNAFGPALLWCTWCHEWPSALFFSVIMIKSKHTIKIWGDLEINHQETGQRRWHRSFRTAGVPLAATMVQRSQHKKNV